MLAPKEHGCSQISQAAKSLTKIPTPRPLLTSDTSIKSLLAGFAVRSWCLCPRADITLSVWVFHPNLSLQKHSLIQDLGKRIFWCSRSSAAGQGPSTVWAAFAVINNGFSPSQAPVLRLLSPLLPYVIPGIPANPVTFSSVPRLQCMATCHMSGIPTSACSSGAAAQWEALLLHPFTLH